MTFSAPFSRVITRPFGGVPSSGVWYLAGGVDPAICAFAYQPKGAADLATSYVNLVTPGTNNAVVVPTLNAPDFATADGWKFNGTDMMLRSSAVVQIQYGFFIIRLSNLPASNSYQAGYTQSNYDQFFLNIDNTSTNKTRYRVGGTSAAAKAPGATSGVFGFGSSDAYRNGIDEGLTLGTNNANTRYFGFGGLVLPTGAKVSLCAQYV